MNKPKENKAEQVIVKRVPGSNKIVKQVHPEMEEALEMWLRKFNKFGCYYEVHHGI